MHISSSSDSRVPNGIKVLTNHLAVAFDRNATLDSLIHTIILECTRLLEALSGFPFQANFSSHDLEERAMQYRNVSKAAKLLQE